MYLGRWCMHPSGLHGFLAEAKSHMPQSNPTMSTRSPTHTGLIQYHPLRHHMWTISCLQTPAPWLISRYSAEHFFAFSMRETLRRVAVCVCVMKICQRSGMLRRPRDPVVPWSERVVILLSTDKVIASVPSTLRYARASLWRIPARLTLRSRPPEWRMTRPKLNDPKRMFNMFAVIQHVYSNLTGTVLNWGTEELSWSVDQSSEELEQSIDTNKCKWHQMACQWWLTTVAAPRFLPMHIMHIMHFAVIQCDPVGQGRPRERHLLQISRPSKDASILNATTLTRSRGWRGCRIIQMFL